LPTNENPISLPQVHYFDLDQVETGSFVLPMKKPINRLEGKTIEHQVDLPIVIHYD